MAVIGLEIRDLRCIEAARLELHPERNLIFGANGAGKTSVLEAAHVLGRGHSFRVRDNRRLVRNGGDFVQRNFSLQGMIERYMNYYGRLAV